MLENGQEIPLLVSEKYKNLIDEEGIKEMLELAILYQTIVEFDF